MMDKNGPDLKKTLKRQLDIDRFQATRLGEEAVRIIQNSDYLISDGTRIEIRDLIKKSFHGTVSYPPEKTVSPSSRGNNNTIIEIHNCTTLAAVQMLMFRGTNPVALNFASAVEPGGGFLRGARAQEEYLARSSTLFACLQNNPMYAYHESQLDPFYSDYVIYSPDVVIFRNDDGELLASPYTCAILTSPAVQANAVRQYMPEEEDRIGVVMWSRILKVLAVAVKHNHSSIVLGAWGCGAFGNDGYEIAGLFKKALDENFAGVFEEVIFAITDWSNDDRFIGPFREVFEKKSSG
jgi:uncharacterized protein (TIGR02452 family)